MTSREKGEIVKLRESGKSDAKVQRIKELNENDVIQRLHQFIRAEKPYFLPIINPIDLFKPHYVHPKMSNRRILSQAGAFIIYGLTPPARIKYSYKIEERRFIIPQADKAALRASLEILGINESTLFPELDRAAKRIEANYTSL
jgi:hypothetical protein